jgi:hypothetical protein
MSQSQPIIIFLQGGLGNQLFQYAAGLRLASDLSGTLWLLPANENIHSKRDYRISMMFRGNLAEKYLVNPENPPVTKLWQQPGAFDTWEPQMFANKPAMYIKGFFQYLPAIQEKVDIICKDIGWTFATIRQEIAANYRITEPANTVCVHVRRGDYLKAKPESHWVLGPDYYIAAIQALQANLGRPCQWLVVSDDPAWCREQPWMRLLKIVEEPDEVASLILMSLCKGGTVMANSSFSWWGAQLAGGPAVYPSKWYKNEKPELFPAEWIRIEI